MAQKTYTVQSGDTKTKLKNKFGLNYDFEGYKSKDKNQLFAGETLTFDDNAYNLDSVKPASPLTIQTQKAPEVVQRPLEALPQLGDIQSQDPSKVGVNPNLIAEGRSPAQQEQQTAPEVPIGQNFRDANTQDQFSQELQTKKTELEGNIEELSRSIANIPSATLEAQERMGINQDQKQLQSLREQLSGVKQDLLIAQDRDTEIRELGKQFVSDYGGTDRDLGQLTNADLRKNSLDQLALSRTYSRLGDATANFQASINSNLSIINERADAERSKLEFDINQKNQVLDRVISAQGSIISNKQAKALEEAKFNNSMELERQKVDLATKKMLLEKAVQNGYDVAKYTDLHNMDMAKLQRETSGPSTVSDLLSADQQQMQNFTAGQWKAYNALNEAETREEEEIAQIKANKAISSQSAEGVISIIERMLEDSDGLEASVGLGGFGNTDFSLFGFGNESTEFRSLANQLTSKTTLATLVQLKQDGGTMGALSDKEGVMLEKAGTGGLGKMIKDKNGDPTGRFEANEKDFIENLEMMKMAQMKIYLASNTEGKWEASKLRDLDFDEDLGLNSEGETITGYMHIQDLYNDAKSRIIRNKEVELRDVDGNIVESRDSFSKDVEINRSLFEGMKQRIDGGGVKISAKNLWNGVITGLRGSKYNAEGLDYAISGKNRGYDAPVPSPVSGKVIKVVSGFVGDKLKPIANGMAQNNGWGNQVQVQLADGRTIQFSHLSDVGNYKEGDTINQGEILGKQGNTGRTYSNSGGNGAHLDILMADASGSVIPPQEVAKILQV